MVPLALLLPIVTAAEPTAVTVQMRVFDVPASMSITPRWREPAPSKQGDLMSYLSPKSPSETQLAAWAKRGEITAVASPIVRTLSGKEATITTTVSMDEDNGKGATKGSTQFQLRIIPTVQRDETIRVDFAAERTRSGKGDEVLFRAKSMVLMRENVPTYFVISPRENVGRSVLVTMRVFRS